MAAGNGQPAEWSVQADADAPSPPNAVMVSADCTAEFCYQLLLATGFQYEYPDLTVRFRASQGTAGRGGLAFGAQDAANFYAAVVDLAASTAQVMRIVDGNERVLAETPITLKPLAWHSLRVQRNTIISKDFVEMFVDGVLVLSVEDQTLGLGQVGLLSKGKSAVSFDSFHAVPLFSHDGNAQAQISGNIPLETQEILRAWKTTPPRRSNKKMKARTAPQRSKRPVAQQAICLRLLLACLASSASGADAPDQSQLTVDRIFGQEQEFKAEDWGPAYWLKDSSGYTTLEVAARLKDSGAAKDANTTKDIVRYTPEFGEREIIVAAESLIPPGQPKPLPIEDYAW